MKKNDTDTVFIYLFNNSTTSNNSLYVEEKHRIVFA